MVIATSISRHWRGLLCPTQKHGLVIIPDGTPNGDVNHEPQPSGITVVSQEAAQLLESAGEGPLGESSTARPKLIARESKFTQTSSMNQTK